MTKHDPKRYTTKCIDCGDTIRGFNDSRRQTCRCGKITAHDGIVEEEGRVKVKIDQQKSMFDNQTDYQE